MEKRSFLVLILSFIFFSCCNTSAQIKQFYIYGYGQVDFTTSNKKGSISGFDQKRMNVIGEFFPDEKLRILTDVEYEGGIDMTANDPTARGTIKLTRGWVEYTVMPELKIRAGKMLTHFGLYNLTHDASASYFPIDPPIIYNVIKLFKDLPAQRLYSKYQLGVEAFGTVDLNSSGSQLEYSLGIGNGRGSLNDGTDVNNNKSISARCIFRPSSLQGFQVGGSFYVDRNFTGLGGIENDLEYTSGLDVQYENSSFQLQVEGIVSNFKISENTSQSAAAGYIQLAYSLFDDLVPFANYSLVLGNLKDSEKKFTRVNLGINFGVTPNLFLKSEVQFHNAEEGFEGDSFQVFKISAAFAF